MHVGPTKVRSEYNNNVTTGRQDKTTRERNNGGVDRGKGDENVRSGGRKSKALKTMGRVDGRNSVECESHRSYLYDIGHGSLVRFEPPARRPFPFFLLRVVTCYSNKLVLLD